MLRTLFFCLVFLMLLASCASLDTNKIPSGMTVSTKEAVSNCKFIGDVHGVSGLYGVFVETALAKSRIQAFEQAKALGADTLVWDSFVTQQGSTAVHGNAYKCL